MISNRDSLHTHNIRFADFGTMLEIRGIKYFEDGRSLLDTVGGRRFRVVERDVKDGYQVANVEFLEDAIPVDSDVWELQVLTTNLCLVRFV